MTSFHIRPDPDCEGAWLVMEQTDQEAYEYDREGYGESLALANWQELYALRRRRERGEIPLDVDEGAGE